MRLQILPLHIDYIESKIYNLTPEFTGAYFRMLKFMWERGCKPIRRSKKIIGQITGLSEYKTQQFMAHIDNLFIDIGSYLHDEKLLLTYNKSLTKKQKKQEKTIAENQKFSNEKFPKNFPNFS